MKVVILAAGKGVRMGELTKDLPKPLLIVGGKTILEHKLDLLPKNTKEIIIIINYLGHLVKEHIGNVCKGIPVKYVMSDLKGTAHALFSVKEYLSGNFLVMAGDDLYHKLDIESMMNNSSWTIQVAPVTNLINGGAILFKDGKLENVIEGIHSNGHIVTSMYLLNQDIFNYKQVKISDEEYGLPQTIVTARHDRDINIMVARTWIQIGKPEDIENANKVFTENPNILLR